MFSCCRWFECSVTFKDILSYKNMMHFSLIKDPHQHTGSLASTTNPFNPVRAIFTWKKNKKYKSFFRNNQIEVDSVFLTRLTTSFKFNFDALSPLHNFTQVWAKLSNLTYFNCLQMMNCKSCLAQNYFTRELVCHLFVNMSTGGELTLIKGNICWM